eukprot:Hpha_TRINITY_DN30914_c0_g1::TRINITY_DN30914_c0_g1_i1::g.112380::m.112380
MMMKGFAAQKLSEVLVSPGRASRQSLEDTPQARMGRIQQLLRGAPSRHPPPQLSPQSGTSVRRPRKQPTQSPRGGGAREAPQRRSKQVTQPLHSAPPVRPASPAVTR